MLGVLGGMGPMATIDFMRKLVEATPATCDQDHLQTIVCGASHIPDRTAAILGHGCDPIPAMMKALQRLEIAGATHIAIPCNTAHHWHSALQAATAIPILHIVDAVVAALLRKGVRRGPIGLLATDGTIAADIYQNRLMSHGFSCRTADAQHAVMRAISLIKAGQTAEAGAMLRKEAEDLLASGCPQVVLACTEIPLALDVAAADLTPHLLDATAALAHACVAAVTSENRGLRGLRSSKIERALELESAIPV